MKIKPYVTEKTLKQAKDGVFTFTTDRKINKLAFGSMLKKLHKVDILKIATLNQKPSARRFKGYKGKTKAYRKMVVRIKKGQKIPGFEVVETTATDNEKTQKAQKDTP